MQSQVTRMFTVGCMTILEIGLQWITFLWLISEFQYFVIAFRFSFVEFI